MRAFSMRVNGGMGLKSFIGCYAGVSVHTNDGM